MKKVLFWTAWAALPVGALAFHMGPGQEWMARDRAAERVRLATVAETGEDFDAAAAHYAAARAGLPPGSEAEAMRLQLLEARAKINGGKLVEAQEQLGTMLETAGPDDQTLIRSMLGESSYYAAWVMRLEGAAEEEWRVESELARQEFRHLAETLADPLQDQINLEEVIRLERMSLDELKAQPLPKQCSGCKNCSQKKRSQRMSKSQPKKPSDARKQVNQQSQSDALEWGKGS
ncbi:MAG: hypothetical protein ACOYN0_12125 [Phycisphaerales bacterium]